MSVTLIQGKDTKSPALKRRFAVFFVINPEFVLQDAYFTSILCIWPSKISEKEKTAAVKHPLHAVEASDR